MTYLSTLSEMKERAMRREATKKAAEAEAKRATQAYIAKLLAR